MIFIAQAQKDYNIKKGFVTEGFDVVFYFENKAEKVSENYTTTYDNAKYKFTSQAHSDTFLTNPKH